MAERKIRSMKMILAGLLASAALMVAPAAFAGTVVDANVDLTAVSQVTTAKVTQAAASAAYAVGTLAQSTVSSAAVDALQIAEIDANLTTVLGSANRVLTGNLEASSLDQSIKAPLAQTAASVAASGALWQSELESAATNVAQDGTVKVNLTVTH